MADTLEPLVEGDLVRVVVPGYVLRARNVRGGDNIDAIEGKVKETAFLLLTFRREGIEGKSRPFGSPDIKLLAVEVANELGVTVSAVNKEESRKRDK